MLSLKHIPHKVPGEKIVKVVRRDFFVLLKKMILTLIMAIMPLLAFYLLLLRYPGITLSDHVQTGIILFISAYYIFVSVFSFFFFVDYYLDVWIITTERILSIEQRGLFSRIESEQKISRIQDVTSEVHGIIPTIFNYGAVYVQTAGKKNMIEFKQVPCPDTVRKEISILMKTKSHKNREAFMKG